MREGWQQTQFDHKETKLVVGGLLILKTIRFDMQLTPYISWVNDFSPLGPFSTLDEAQLAAEEKAQEVIVEFFEQAMKLNLFFPKEGSS